MPKVRLTLGSVWLLSVNLSLLGRLEEVGGRRVADFDHSCSLAKQKY